MLKEGRAVIGCRCRTRRKLPARNMVTSMFFIKFSSEMTSQALNARLTSLFESLKQTQQLVTRLSKSSTQGGGSHSNPDESDARGELSAEIHQSLKEQEEDFELLRQEIEDQTNPSSWSLSVRRRESGRDSQRTDLAAQITRLGEDLKM